MFTGGAKIGAFNISRLPFSNSSVLSDLELYRNRIIANGGTISDNSLQAVGTFINTLKTNNIWDKFLEIGIYAGNDLNAALVKLKYPTGVQSTLTNVGFVSGDYSETTGLTGNTTGTKYLKTGFIPSNQLVSSNDAHLSVYARNSTAILGISGGNNAKYLGSTYSDGSNEASFYISRNSSSISGYLGYGYGGGGQINVLTSGTTYPGYLLFSTTNSNGYLIYNTITKGSVSTVGIDSGLSNIENFVFAVKNNMVVNGICNLICGFHSFGYGLTTTQAAIAYNAVQALQTSLGRQV